MLLVLVIVSRLHPDSCGARLLRSRILARPTPRRSSADG